LTIINKTILCHNFIVLKKDLNKDIISYINNLLYKFNRILYVKIIKYDNFYECLIRGNYDKKGKRLLKNRKRKLNKLFF